MLLDLQNLSESPCMASLWYIASSQERIDNFECQFRANDSSPDAQDIHVIVLNTLMGRIGIVTNCGSDARNLVGRHTDSHAAATNHNPAICSSLDNLSGNRDGKVRIVTTVTTVRATIRQYGCRTIEPLGNSMFEWESCVITTECNSQRS